MIGSAATRAPPSDAVVRGGTVHPDRVTRCRPGSGTVILLRASGLVTPVEELLMTDLGSSRPDVDTSRVAYGNSPDPTGWTGWVVFAGFLMIMLGLFQGIQGLVAIFDDGYYHVTQRGLVVNVDYTAWGWTHLIIGVLIVAAGIGVLTGNLAARILGVVLAGLSAVVNIAFLAAFPVWSVIIITVDVLVIYALIVHGRELRDTAS
jgi:hypothetical protein